MIFSLVASDNILEFDEYIKMVNKEYYIEFGKIVYAMAMADGARQAEEQVA